MAQLSHGTPALQERDLTFILPLTDTQIVKMDETHYMRDVQKQFFHARLVALEELLLARTRESASEIAVRAAGADPIDPASTEEEHQLAITARARDAEQLLEVRAVLNRIKTGQFGCCIATGEMIGVGRLLICPTTVLCVKAQQRRENKSTRYRS